MLTLYLARHGETDYNHEGRLQGQLPVPLNERGRSQAKRLARRMAEIPLDAIVSSDLPRALGTAEIVAEVKGLPVQTNAGWRERNLGHWQNNLYREVKEEMDACDWDSPKGETRAELKQRVMNALADLTDKYDSRTILVISHGGPCHVVLKQIAGSDYGHAFHQWHNTAISTLGWEQDTGWQVVNLYDDSHLEGDATNFAEATGRE